MKRCVLKLGRRLAARWGVMVPSMAFEFDRQQARRDVDPRRVAFDKALSILGALNKNWAMRQKQHYDEMLSRSR